MKTISTTARARGFSLSALLPGLALTSVLGVLAIRLGESSWSGRMGLGALTLAILAGILLGNTLYPRLQVSCGPGVDLARQHLLRLGIVFYGFRLTFQQIAEVGRAALLIDLLMLGSTFLLACWLGWRLLGLDRETAMLIGAGSSICGAAAIVASEPVVRGGESRVAVAVSTVVVFGTLAMFLSPWLCPLLLPDEPRAFGVYIGSTVHEVAQVVAAGRSLGEEAGNAAVIAKMIRVMLLAPFLFLLAGYLKTLHGGAGGERARGGMPWFALLFVAVAGFNSLALLPAPMVDWLVELDTLLLAMAMAALGLGTHLRAIRRAGWRPLLLALLLFIWLVLGGGLINRLVGALC